MAGSKGKGGKADGTTNNLIYNFDEKQFWNAWAKRKGYVSTKGETYSQTTFENMILFMVDILPLTYADLSTFGYRHFFRTLKVAQNEAIKRTKAMEAKNRKKK